MRVSVEKMKHTRNDTQLCRRCYYLGIFLNKSKPNYIKTEETSLKLTKSDVLCSYLGNTTNMNQTSVSKGLVEVNDTINNNK